MRSAAVVAVGLVALTGCGHADRAATTTKGTVDDAAVESGIKEQLSSPSAKVTTVKCPSDVESTPGATFTCSVAWSNGATGKVKVTQANRNQFTYEPVPGSVEVPGATVEQSLQDELAKQGAANAAVNCPDNIIVKLDTTVTCDVSGANGNAAGTVTFAFSSAAGTIDTSSVETGG